MEEINGFILYLADRPTAAFIGGVASLICLDAFLSITKGDKPLILDEIEDFREWLTTVEIWHRK